MLLFSSVPTHLFENLTQALASLKDKVTKETVSQLSGREEFDEDSLDKVGRVLQLAHIRQLPRHAVRSWYCQRLVVCACSPS